MTADEGMEDAMTISNKLRDYMDRCGTQYDEIIHEPAVEMARAAEVAHVPGRQVAKGVLIQGRDDFIVAVVPASKHVGFEFLNRWFSQKVDLAEEVSASILFPDCAPGAVPPVGAAYGLKTIIDDEMLTNEDVLFRRWRSPHAGPYECRKLAAPADGRWTLRFQHLNMARLHHEGGFFSH
jgi:Ala-tRNA(Pro) deacylase